MSPLSGQISSDPVEGQEVSFSGYTDSPTKRLKVQVLADAGSDPYAPDADWVTLGDAVAPSPIPVFDPKTGDIGFPWRAERVLVENAGEGDRWRDGGLARVRVVEASRRIQDPKLASFDLYRGEECVQGYVSTGTAVKDAIASCSDKVGDSVITLVNTEDIPNPASGADDHFLAFKETDSSDAIDYLHASGVEDLLTVLKNDGPRNTLGRFIEANGFDPSTDLPLVYANEGDLGFGREMRCREVRACEGSQPVCEPETSTDEACEVVVRTACYVTNYGEIGQDVHLNLLFVGAVPFATVAMEKKFKNATSDSCTAASFIDAPPENDVIFLVYPHSELTDPLDSIGGSEAELDTEGPKSMPGVCLACHGGSYDASKNAVVGARFLPFDREAMLFSGEPDEVRLYEFNKLVKATEPEASEMSQLIDGWYEDYSKTHKQDADWRPAGWEGHERVYDEVIAPHCRSCHLAIDKTDPTCPEGLLFNSFDGLNCVSGLVYLHTCITKLMPQAEVTHRRFWESPARAYLAADLGFETHCSP